MSNEVRELREAAGLSQVELSLRSGVAQPNIAAYETGRRRASADMIERLRAAARPRPSEVLASHHDELELPTDLGSVTSGYLVQLLGEPTVREATWIY